MPDVNVTVSPINETVSIVANSVTETVNVSVTPTTETITVVVNENDTLTTINVNQVTENVAVTVNAITTPVDIDVTQVTEEVHVVVVDSGPLMANVGKHFEYDVNKRLLSVTDALGSKTFVRNINGKIINIIGTGLYKNKQFNYNVDGKIEDTIVS